MSENQIEENNEQGPMLDHHNKIINYGAPEYWDERYSIPEEFEWYQSWVDFKPFLKKYEFCDEKTKKVLHIGNGNSPVPIHMVKDEDLKHQFHECIDISSVVIGQMQSKYKDLERVHFQTMDCMQLAFENESFDAVFDKGTFDALMCGPQANEKTRKEVQEIHRVLKPKGRFFLMSYNERDEEIKTAGEWKSVKVIELENPNIAIDENQKSVKHFLHICVKK